MIDAPLSSNDHWVGFMPHTDRLPGVAVILARGKSAPRYRICAVWVVRALRLVMLNRAPKISYDRIIHELNTGLDDAGLNYSSEIYPGTVHGFTMVDTDAFDADGLQRHWDNVFTLLDDALAAH